MLPDGAQYTSWLFQAHALAITLDWFECGCYKCMPVDCIEAGQAELTTSSIGEEIVELITSEQIKDLGNRLLAAPTSCGNCLISEWSKHG